MRNEVYRHSLVSALALSSKRKRNTFLGWRLFTPSPKKGWASPKTRCHHLSMQDRVEIEKLLESGVSKAQIARRLGCHRSTVSREIREVSWSPEASHANLGPYLRNRLGTRIPRQRLYLAHPAHHQEFTRKLASHKPYRMEYGSHADQVLSRLRSGLTLEEIAGRLPRDFPASPRMRVSTETLYA